MHTIAIGEDAMLFLENPEEELNMVDDCAPYVLTLVKGPIIVDLQELNFLSNCKIGSCQPEEKLSEDCIAKLKIYSSKNNAYAQTSLCSGTHHLSESGERIFCHESQGERL